MSRLEDLKRFYEILNRLERKLDGARTLADSGWEVGLLERGVYFFFDPCEERSNSGKGPRVVRVGISPEKNKNKTTLSSRLGKHRGPDTYRGGGRARDSAFRRHMGNALIKRDSIECPTWNSTEAPKGAKERKQERLVDKEVSRIIRQMPFLWVEVADQTLRGSIEENATALLSNFGKAPLDKPSDTWLGHCAVQPRIRKSGQWSSDYVDAPLAPNFLHDLEYAVDEMQVDT